MSEFLGIKLAQNIGEKSVTLQERKPGNLRVAMPLVQRYKDEG